MEGNLVYIKNYLAFTGIVIALMVFSANSFADTSTNFKNIDKLKVKRKGEEQYQLAFPKDGQAVSLEPLDKSQCFGETYLEASVRQFLSDLYYKDDVPVSGMGLFMGVDKFSQAYKSKEFRYFFKFNDTSQQELEQEIFDRILAYTAEFYELLDFTGRRFELTEQTKKEISSYTDIPVIYIENIVSSKNFIDNFLPFEKSYWNIVDRKGANSINKSIKKIKNGLLRALSSPETFLTNHNGRSVAMDFSEDRFHLEGKNLNGINHFYYSLYGYYIFHYEDNRLLEKKEVSKISLKFMKGVLSVLFGYRLNSINKPIKSDINSILVETNDLVPNDVIKASNFEKTLFLSMYKRIKPLNMEKQNFIDAVIKVMKPCII